MSEHEFTNPAQDSAVAFRAFLAAVSRPGQPQILAVAVTPPDPMPRAMAAVALTLLDFQTSFWLSPHLHTPAIRKFLQFHTGARLQRSHELAQFCFLSTEDALPPLSSFLQGTHEYPDRSATLVIAAGDLSAGQPVEFSGPGIKVPRAVRVGGLPAGFWSEAAASRGDFPLGVDIIFTHADALLACPRSTGIRKMEEA